MIDCRIPMRPGAALSVMESASVPGLPLSQGGELIMENTRLMLWIPGLARRLPVFLFVLYVFCLHVCCS